MVQEEYDLDRYERHEHAQWAQSGPSHSLLFAHAYYILRCSLSWTENTSKLRSDMERSDADRRCMAVYM